MSPRGTVTPAVIDQIDPEQSIQEKAVKDLTILGCPQPQKRMT